MTQSKKVIGKYVIYVSISLFTIALSVLINYLLS